MRNRDPWPRTVRLAAALCAAAVLHPAAFADDERADFDERGANAFFGEPDSRTAKRIDELVHSFSSDGVSARRGARAELEGIGFWAVDPLIAAVEELEPPIKCASILTLEAIGDRRAVEPLRESIVENSARPYVPGFAALALGRFRDPDAVPTFARSLDSPRTLQTLRPAVPLALARIHTDAARDVLLAQLRKPRAREEARMAQYLALGFFPSAALDGDQRFPGKRLESGLTSRRTGERAAALLGYLVATVDRRDTLEYLLAYTGRQQRPEVIQAGLLGISRQQGGNVTEYLSGIAADKRSDDEVRAYATDLLARRADPAAKADLLRILHSAAPRRIRAAAVLALASIEEPETVAVVLARLGDTAPLVRATAALAAAHFEGAAAREKALAAIDARRRVGDRSPGVRRTLTSAHAVLSGRRTGLRWDDPREAYGHVIFQRFALSYEERLLAEVNLRAEYCLDLKKIHNLAGDTELTPADAEASAAPAEPDDADDDAADTGTVGDGGESESEGEADPGPSIEDEREPAEDPEVNIPNTEEDDRPRSGDHLATGKSKTANWQELRDLKVHLRRRPYFSLPDLPRTAESTSPK